MPASKPFRPTSQVELRATANMILLTFDCPVTPEMLKEIESSARYSMPDYLPEGQEPTLAEIKIVYSDGFGRIVPKD